jgi:hypothetical protein
MADQESPVDTSDEACAVVCMLVSNPGGGERQHAWQKRVNDLIRALRDERASLRRWVADLQSGMYINCVYCGHRYGPDSGTPVAMADVLKAHIERCPEHPLARLRKEARRAIGKINGDEPGFAQEILEEALK